MNEDTFFLKTALIIIEPAAKLLADGLQP